MVDATRKDEHDPASVRLREVVEDDLPTLFAHQREPEANRMAAFPARDEKEFMSLWRASILGGDDVIKRAVLHRDILAGHIVCYEQAGSRLVGYWLGKNFWGKGIATSALAQFVTDVEIRPLRAYVAQRNVASIRVLEKCGFKRAGQCTTPARDGGEPIDEFIYELVG